MGLIHSGGSKKRAKEEAKPPKVDAVAAFQCQQRRD